MTSSASWTVFLYQYFIVTPAIGGVFIAGFLAPRASWLLFGIMVGIVAAACYSFLVLRGFIGIAPTAETQQLAGDVILASFLLSPLVGAFFASTAPRYRRFLYLSNPTAAGPGAVTHRAPTAARSSSQGLGPPLAGPSQGATSAINPAFASPRGPSAGRRSAARAPPASAASETPTSRATRFTTDPSRLRSPSTSSNAC